MTTRTRSPRRSHLRTGIAGGLALALAAGLAGLAPANSEPMSQSSNREAVQRGDDPYNVFTSDSPLEVASMGDGRARVGRPSPFPEVRNPASRTVKNLPSQAELDSAMRKALRGMVWTPKPDPIPDADWREIDAVVEIAGAAPLIGRLPVAFDTFAVGKQFRDDVKADKSMWKGVSFPYGSFDPAIAKASIRAYDAIVKNQELAQRSTDMGLAYGAVDVVRAEGAKANASGVMVTGQQSFAQLGVTPFVRLFATGQEARDLYEQGLLVDVMLDSAGEIDLTDTVEDIQADRYKPPWNRQRWAPALEDSATGRFTTVAVLDSGVNVDGRSIPFQRRVDGACFIACDGADSATAVVEGLEASNPCPVTLSPACDHGTHVASIIASQASTLPDGTPIPAGVAPSAQLASYRICVPDVDDAGNPTASCPTSAAIQALGRATTSASRLDIAAANLSFTTPNQHRSCPDRPRNRAFRSAVGAASAAGITVVHANGNGSRFRYAACDPTIVEVANATKAGAPAPSSDFHPSRTTLWAPGSRILAESVDNAGAPNIELKSGTSMAAPHVAGAMALIAQSVREYNMYGARADEEETSVMAIRDLMLGIAPTDPARVMITDNRTGTDPSGNTTSGSDAAPLLSLRNLWMLLDGDPLSSLTTVPTYSVPNASSSAPPVPTVADLTPRTWTVTSDWVRREYNGGATPLRSSHVFFSGEGRVQLTPANTPRLATAGDTYVDGPYLVVYTRNGTVLQVTDGSNSPLAHQTIAKGPQPCTRAGWVESIRVPLSPDQQANGNFFVNVSGPDPYAISFFEGTIASATTNKVATDPRPRVFGGSRTFPDPVDLGGHRPDVTNSLTYINWFDLDRITGDVPMIDDAINAGSFGRLSGTRVPNDAVDQDFFISPLTNRNPVITSSDTAGLIGWEETPGVQDCAVAMGHYWIGK